MGFNDGLSSSPPETVFNTALTSSGNITITFPDDYSYRYILLFYFAELNSTANASSLDFYLETPGYSGGILLHLNRSGTGVFSAGAALFLDLLYTPGTDIVLYPDQTVSSPLGPIANALEFWQTSTNPMAPVTENQDGELLIWL